MIFYLALISPTDKGPGLVTNYDPFALSISLPVLTLWDGDGDVLDTVTAPPGLDTSVVTRSDHQTHASPHTRGLRGQSTENEDSSFEFIKAQLSVLHLAPISTWQELP